jgi:hypothetical protein
MGIKKVGAAVAVATGAALALYTSIGVVNPPSLAIGFTDAKNEWVNDDWTNYYHVRIFASPDLADWHEIFPKFDEVSGRFCFVLPMTNRAEFYRAQFIALP